MSEQEVDGVAQGRVGSGRRAVDNHLVDQIGGLDDAIDYACLKAGVARDEIEVEILPTRQYSVLPELKVLALLSDFAGSVLGSSYSNSELTFNLGPADGLMSRLPYDIVLNY
jgi:protease-4